MCLQTDAYCRSSPHDSSTCWSIVIGRTAKSFAIGAVTELTALTQLQLSVQSMIARGLSLPWTLKDGANQAWACTQ